MVMTLALLLATAPSTSAGIITAFAGVLTALALIIGALPALIKVLAGLKRVEHLVNQTHTDLTNYNRALVRALQKAGIAVPEDQSQGVVDKEPMSIPTPPITKTATDASTDKTTVILTGEMTTAETKE